MLSKRPNFCYQFYPTLDWKLLGKIRDRAEFDERSTTAESSTPRLASLQRPKSRSQGFAGSDVSRRSRRTCIRLDAQLGTPDQLSLSRQPRTACTSYQIDSTIDYDSNCFHFTVAASLTSLATALVQRDLFRIAPSHPPLHADVSVTPYLSHPTSRAPSPHINLVLPIAAPCC